MLIERFLMNIKETFSQTFLNITENVLKLNYHKMFTKRFEKSFYSLSENVFKNYYKTFTKRFEQSFYASFVKHS